MGFFDQHGGVFTISSKGMNNVDFISVRSVQGILTYATQILLIGLAETLIIITAGIDLSAGYMLGLAAVIGAQIMKVLYAAGSKSSSSRCWRVWSAAHWFALSPVLLTAGW